MSDRDWTSPPAEIVGTLKCVTPERMAELERAEVERDALRSLLAGFSGPPPSPRQWADICNKAAELSAVLKEKK
jgi:hypothetical protein